MYEVIVVGCGQVVRTRILPAMNELAQQRLMSCRHVVDLMPHEAVAAALTNVAPQPPTYHRIGSAPGELARLLKREELRGLPLIVATPTPRHVEHACAALDAGCTVALEKPLAATAGELAALQAHVARTDGRQLFPLGYYLLEKGLPLLALARRGALPQAQLGCVAGLSSQRDWAMLRDQLGAIVSVVGILREGSDSRAWVLADEAGGHTLETFSHLVAMVLPWFDEVTLRRAVLGRTAHAPSGNSESVIFAQLEGTNRVPVRLGCEKWSTERPKERSLEITFEHGKATMDLEQERLVVQIGGGERVACVATKTKYEAQLRMFASKLDHPDEPTEFGVCARSVLLALAVREQALRKGMQMLTSSWLDEQLAARSSDD